MADAGSVERSADDGAGAGPVVAVAAAWFLSLGFDLFLHAGVLARLDARGGAFLLPAEDAFRRIPLGYAAFLVLTMALAWLFRRIGVKGALAGFRLGLLAGLVLWGAWTLGLYSVSVAEPDLLMGWWIGQGVEMGLAGAVLLQVAGLAPPMKTLGPR